MSKKRREPENVDPVEANGIRYEAPLQGALYGYAQDGGIIIARDADSGELEWTQRIYKVSYDKDIEDDKQDIFISKLSLAEGRTVLNIKNERGVQFNLDLIDRSVVETN
jgi:hypothetical protein